MHESTGYSPYLVNFGRSLVLPVDVMLDRFDRERNDGTIPQYIKEVRKTLKNAYVYFPSIETPILKIQPPGCVATDNIWNVLYENGSCGLYFIT